MLPKGDKANMGREPIDRQNLLALVTEIASKFPPQGDSHNVRSFRLISVDYLQGKITHLQFNLLYTKDKTVEQITDGLVSALNARKSHMPLNPGRTGETIPESWRLQRGKNCRRF
jgi:hypothetical protein